MTVQTRLDGTISSGLRGRDVLAALFAFFGVIFAVNGYFLYAAISTHTGVVANEPYRKGLAYNERIAADERQAQLGWTATLEVERNGLIRLALRDRDGLSISAHAVTGTIGRPATSKSDQAVTLRESEPGIYFTKIGVLSPGSWIASLDITDRSNATGPSYQLRRRLWLKP